VFSVRVTLHERKRATLAEGRGVGNLLHVGEQILFGFCQLGRYAAGFFFDITPGTGSLRSSESNHRAPN
jgi:hypothetical protein